MQVGQVGGFGAAYVMMQSLGLLPLPEAAASKVRLAEGSGRGKRVVILGAGIAGMVAAWELQKAGYSCTILEARGRSDGLGSDPSCPNAGSIPCLLLQVIGSEQGPAGGKLLTKTTFIQRLNTSGGSAPATGCSVPGDVGKQALVPYSADYIFFRTD
jgi:hypothetical protein